MRRKHDPALYERVLILHEIAQHRAKCDAAEDENVLWLRARGVSWRDIAEALGQPHTRVYDRHVDRCRPHTPEAVLRDGRGGRPYAGGVRRNADAATRARKTTPR